MSCAKPPRLAPALSARTALALSEPKLIAEMLNTLASYGCVQPLAAWPTVTRKSWLASTVGTSEWLIHSWPSACTSSWVPNGRLSD